MNTMNQSATRLTRAARATALRRQAINRELYSAVALFTVFISIALTASLA
jgi:hypothetical protein